MKPLEPPDTFHAEAAEGWLELGNHIQAGAELDQIAPGRWAHPDVLELRWHVYAAAKKWETALEIASALIQLVPEHQAGWVHRSYCLNELKLTAEARDNLLPIVAKFPDDATIRYDLACYECKLGGVDQGRIWLENAFRIGDSRRMKQAALNDPDLARLWKSLRIRVVVQTLPNRFQESL